VGGGASRERKTALEAKSQGPVYPRERPIGGKDSRAQYLEDDSVPPPANAKQRAEQRKQAEGAKPLKRTPRTEASNASDERPLDVKSQSVPLDEFASDSGPLLLPDPEPLPAAAKEKGELLTRVFGDVSARCMFSKDWQLRRHGFVDALNAAALGDAKNAEVWPGACAACLLALDDKVLHVAQAGCDLLETTLASMGSKRDAATVTAAVEPCVPMLLDLLALSNPKSAKMGSFTLLFLVEHSKVWPST